MECSLTPSIKPGPPGSPPQSTQAVLSLPMLDRPQTQPSSCDFQEPEVDMSSRPSMGLWVMGSAGRQEPQRQLLPAPHSISDSLELGVSPCWNKTLTLKQNRQRQPAKPLPSQPVVRGYQQISSHVRHPAGFSLQSLDLLMQSVRWVEQGADEATVMCGPMAELEPGKAVQSSSPQPWGKRPVSEALSGWPLMPGGLPREKNVNFLVSLGSQLRLPVWERIKGYTV